MTSVGFCLKRRIKKTVKANMIVPNKGINRTACQSSSFPAIKKKQIVIWIYLMFVSPLTLIRLCLSRMVQHNYLLFDNKYFLVEEFFKRSL